VRAYAALVVAFGAAVTLHALWDTTDSTLKHAGIGVLSGGLLVARIRRAGRVDYDRGGSGGIDSPADDSTEKLADHRRTMRPGPNAIPTEGSPG
jgi:hypothetical protein